MNLLGADDPNDALGVCMLQKKCDKDPLRMLGFTDETLANFTYEPDLIKAPTEKVELDPSDQSMIRIWCFFAEWRDARGSPLSVEDYINVTQEEFDAF